MEDNSIRATVPKISIMRHVERHENQPKAVIASILLPTVSVLLYALTSFFVFHFFSFSFYVCFCSCFVYLFIFAILFFTFRNC